MNPLHIAVTDQWLASLREQVKPSLESVRSYIAACGGDESKAYIAVSRNLADHIDFDAELRARVAYSYVSTLFLLARQEQQ